MHNCTCVYTYLTLREAYIQCVPLPIEPGSAGGTLLRRNN